MQVHIIYIDIQIFTGKHKKGVYNTAYEKQGKHTRGYLLDSGGDEHLFD